ncbi:MAG: hypothetical protein SGJ09_04335 [Phycisphaerae bacterium]|mgnify:CR=1 FL=1|nr:hypothetical protein [Phycisphaerae bacterium]
MSRITVTTNLTFGSSLALAVACAASATTSIHTGPSSSADPYVRGTPGSPVRDIVSILTVGDSVNGYTLLGIPDGMGDYSNGDGTFSLLVAHEHQPTANGVQHSHQPAGFAGGAFVSKWVIDESTFAVSNGTDAMTSVVTTSNGAGGTLYNFARFCSADLAATTAYFNAGSGNGTQDRIFLHGEESGSNGRLMATDVNTGVSYQLQPWDPLLGAWENALARPHVSESTVVIGLSDGGANRVFLYVGTKQASGNAIERAGLLNGLGWGIQVQVNGVNVAAESRDFCYNSSGRPNYSATFTIAAGGTAAGTSFLRPEDGAWDPANPNDFYFVTTDRFNSASQVGRSRLHRLRFSDVNNVLAGGTIEALLDGTEGQQMFDNLSLSNTIQGGTNLVIQEDPGNQEYNAKTHLYKVASDTLTAVLMSDPARFGDIGIPATAPFSKDEENSGVVDARETLGLGWFVGNTQAHYPLANPLVEGGQVYAFFLPEAVGSCATDVTLDGVTDGADLAVFLGAWGLPGTTDFNGDGTTDGADLAALLGAWGNCGA